MTGQAGPNNRSTSTEPGGGERELLSFRVADQEYAIDIMSVREIRGWTKATSLPHAPGYVRGVVNLRGTVLTVIDLGQRLSIASDKPSARSVIIVVEIGRRTVGLRVDAVSDILTIPIGDMLPPPELLADKTENFLRGLSIIDGRMIRVLDLSAVLSCHTTAA